MQLLISGDNLMKIFLLDEDAIAISDLITQKIAKQGVARMRLPEVEYFKWLR